MVMFMLETHRRVRRAAEIVANYGAADHREDVLWRAWDLLQALSREQFPEELRSKFDYLKHELSLRKDQEMSAREIGFLIEKIRELGEDWIEPPLSSPDIGRQQF
jgi:hypothetical protein